MSAELSAAADDKAVKDWDARTIKTIIIVLLKHVFLIIVFLPATIQHYCLSCTYLAVMLPAQLAI